MHIDMQETFECMKYLLFLFMFVVYAFYPQHLYKSPGFRPSLQSSDHFSRHVTLRAFV